MDLEQRLILAQSSWRTAGELEDGWNSRAELAEAIYKDCVRLAHSYPLDDEADNFYEAFKRYVYACEVYKETENFELAAQSCLDVIKDTLHTANFEMGKKEEAKHIKKIADGQ